MMNNKQLYSLTSDFYIKTIDRYVEVKKNVFAHPGK